MEAQGVAGTAEWGRSPCERRRLGGIGHVGRGPGGRGACGALVQGRELGTTRWEMVACLEGHDPRRRQGLGRRTEGPRLSSASIWGPLVSPAGICILTPGRGGCQSEMPFPTKLPRCFAFLVCFIYLFLKW